MKRSGLGKKTGMLALLIIISIAVVHIVQVVHASVTAEPGSDADPLVSQSYVDEKINDLSAKVNGLETSQKDITNTTNNLSEKDELMTLDITSLKEADEGLTASIKEISEKEDATGLKIDELTKKFEEIEKKLQDIEKYGKFEALELDENQVLITGASAEIILRGGKALAIGGTGGGLSDITSGTGADIKTDENVPLNHLLLISRDDGRGIKVVSKKAWVLVKGPYTIN